ncbi:MAG TPA: hypothetical protein VEI02_00850 [Planctomycetota bacterium]|nr:hypothetical protein [Planctomycetota bacterium]
MTNPEAQLDGRFARFAPTIAGLGRMLRAKLRARLPGLHEIVYVYENQETLVIAYSPTVNGYEGVCSLSISPRGAKLYFAQGALLSKHDPLKLLQGRAKARYVDLAAPSDFDRPEIETLTVAALKLAGIRVAAGAEGSIVDKADSQKRRARSARPASPRPRSRR